LRPTETPFWRSDCWAPGCSSWPSLLRCCRSTSAGAHTSPTPSSPANHAYALLPVAVLAAGLAVTAWGSGSRFALLAIGLLGLSAVGIALLGDLPDTHAVGLVGTPASGLSTASSSPAIGLFLETGGAVLILSAAAGMLLAPVADTQSRVDSRADTAPTRSAS
jgi:hypothetical protein